VLGDAVGHRARRCPELIFVKPRFDAYREVSNQIRAIFHDYTPHVEPLSLDEAYLDVTEDLKGIGSATRSPRRSAPASSAETGLTASAGVSYNKFLAKLASDQNKPDGLCVVTPARGPAFVARLPVSASTASARRRRRRWRGSASRPAPTWRRRASLPAAPFRQLGGLLSQPRPRHLPPDREAQSRAQVDRRGGHLLARPVAGRDEFLEIGLTLLQKLLPVAKPVRLLGLTLAGLVEPQGVAEPAEPVLPL
jgi:hypothetical protein